MPIAAQPIAGQPIAGLPPSATGIPAPPLNLATGFWWPSIFPQAARALGLGLQSAGAPALVFGSLSQATTPQGTGTPGPTLLASGGLGWVLGPGLPANPMPLPVVEALEGQPTTLGYALDAYAGLLPWNGLASIFSKPAPWIDMAVGTSGLYAINQSGLYTGNGVAVSGVAFTNALSILASGTQFYVLEPATVWAVSLITTTSASGTSASLGFTATCMGIDSTTSGLAIGGYTSYGITPPASIVTTTSAGNLLLAFSSASGSSHAYILSGAPLAWNLLATTTGLHFSSGLAATITPAGNIVLGADAGSGQWDAWTYTGGTLALLASGSASGIAPSIAVEGTSTYAVIPQPSASGWLAIEASGATWTSLGTVATGGPLASATVWVSGTTWGVTLSGAVGALSLANSTWSLTTLASLAWTPTNIALDPSTGYMWAAGPSGQIAAVSSALVATGTWGGSGTIVGILPQHGQVAIATTGSIYYAGFTAPGVITSGASVFTPTDVPTALSLAGPFTDSSYAIAASGSSIFFYRLQAPFSVHAVPSGAWATYTTGTVGATTGLGLRNVPSALGLGASGETWLATTLGYLGPLSGTLASSLPSGGYTNSFTLSGYTILTTTVGGQVLVTTGV